MFLYSTSLKYFFTLFIYIVSASLYPVSYFPMLFEGYTVLVTSPQECLLNWVNLRKYLWKHLLFLFPLPWDLSNIFSGQNAMSNLQVYNVHKYFCCCPHSSESLTPGKTPDLCKQSLFFPAKSDAKWFLLWFCCSSHVSHCFLIVILESANVYLPIAYFI